MQELKWKVEILGVDERVKDSHEFTATKADASAVAEQYFNQRRHKASTDDWRLIPLSK